MEHTLGNSSTEYVKFHTIDFIEAVFQEIVFGSAPQRDLIRASGFSDMPRNRCKSGWF